MITSTELSRRPNFGDLRLLRSPTFNFLTPSERGEGSQLKCPRFSHLLRRNKTWGTSVFPKGTKNVGNIDYVAGWFIKAAEYMGDHTVRTAFVSTNSVVQGEQVANIWYPITQLGFHIDFAHDTFRWANEASDHAHVFCVIVSFSKQKVTPRLFHYGTPDSNPMDLHPSRLNTYLADAPDIFVWNRNRPLWPDTIPLQVAHFHLARPILGDQRHTP